MVQLLWQRLHLLCPPTIYYKYKSDEINCGCFCGTLNEFAAQVEKTHMGNPAHLAAYRAAIEFFRAVREAYAEC